MFHANLRGALVEIASAWGIRRDDLQKQFTPRDLEASAQFEPIEASEARALQIKTPAYRVTITGKQPRLLYLETCKRLRDRNQKTPRLILESRQCELQQDNGLTVSLRRGLRGRHPDTLFPPLRQSRASARPTRASRDR